MSSRKSRSCALQAKGPRCRQWEQTLLQPAPMCSVNADDLPQIRLMGRHFFDSVAEKHRQTERVLFREPELFIETGREAE